MIIKSPILVGIVTGIVMSGLLVAVVLSNVIVQATPDPSVLTVNLYAHGNVSWPMSADRVEIWHGGNLVASQDNVTGSCNFDLQDDAYDVKSITGSFTRTDPVTVSGDTSLDVPVGRFQVRVVDSDFTGLAAKKVEVRYSDSLLDSQDTDVSGDVFFSLLAGGPYEFSAGNALASASVQGMPPSQAGIIVMPTNWPPVLDPIGDKTVDADELLTFVISATDPDGDPLIYSAANLPSGANFDPSTRTFSWTPGYDQAGSYPSVHFEVTDGELTDSEDITITVNNVCLAPNAPPSPICEGETNPTQLVTLTPTFSWTFSDPDVGDTQGAWQIIVSTSPSNVWDSGKQIGADTSAVYGGSPLSRGATYHWAVRTWDNCDVVGPYCDDQTFTIEPSPIAPPGGGQSKEPRVTSPSEVEPSPDQVHIYVPIVVIYIVILVLAVGVILATSSRR